MVDVLDDASNGLDEPVYEIPMYGNSRRPHDDWIHLPLLSLFDDEEDEEEHVVVSSRPVH